MCFRLKQLSLVLLGFLVLFGVGAVPQSNQVVTITVSRGHRGVTEIEVNPLAVTLSMGGTVTFQNAASSIASVTLFSGPADLFQELDPGEQYTHTFKSAGDFTVDIKAGSDSTFMKVTVTTSTAVTPPGGKPAVFMAELLLDAASGEQVVAIANLGKGTASMTGWRLCVGSSCARLPDSALAPQSWVNVHFGVSGNNTSTDAYVSLPNLVKASDELSLFSSDRTESPTDMVDYLRWGNGRTPSRQNVAVSAGLWTLGDSVDVSRLARGQVIRYDGKGRRAFNYSVSAPTMVSSVSK